MITTGLLPWKAALLELSTVECLGSLARDNRQLREQSHLCLCSRPRSQAETLPMYCRCRRLEWIEKKTSCPCELLIPLLRYYNIAKDDMARATTSLDGSPA
jgi:hypothetical protein